MISTKKNSVCLISIVHPYTIFNKFVNSIKNQTFDKFDIVLGDDNFIRNYGEKKFFEELSQLRNPLFIIRTEKTPIENRRMLVEHAKKRNYDIIIFADSDEIMDKNRIKIIFDFLINNPDELLVFNNSVWGDFSLYYKDKLYFSDILDFNVLGFGAMSIKKELIDFLLNTMKHSPNIFDWYFSLIYLSNNKYVSFLKDAKNIYIPHENNTIGPITKITENMITQGIKVKEDVYKALLDYYERNNILSKRILVDEKLNEIKKTKVFINKFGITRYLENVKKYFHNRKNIYWWEYIIPPDKLQTGG